MSDLYVRTASGRNVYLGRDTFIAIEDAANQLAKINRFLGATREPYSVAQHSVWVSKRIREAGHGPTVQMAGLIHDVPEFILGDMARPVQHHIFGKPDRNLCISSPWVDAHNAMMAQVRISLGLPTEWSPNVNDIVDHFDNMALRTEWRDLMTGTEKDNFKHLPECHPDKIVPCRDWREAEASFLWEFNLVTHYLDVERLK